MSAALQQNSRHRNRNSRQHNMSNRGQYSNSNNYRRDTPEPEPSSSSPIRGLYADQRSAIMMCSLVSTRTTVKTRNGSTYKGFTTGFSDKGDIAMSDAKLEVDDNTQDPKTFNIIIQRDDYVVCKANGVDLKGLCSTGSDFTDAGIVNKVNGSSEGQLRELQPWQDEDAEKMYPPESLDDSPGGWDANAMFQVNSEKFNVQSSYNEAMHEYTTKLPDPESEGYEERQRLAQKQAEEIERSESYQNRISKELTDGDEEMRYSAVHRAERGGDSHPPHRPHESNSSSGKNTYTIPALRGDGEQNLRNGNMSRGQGRGLQRQNPPYSSANHPQQQQHQYPPHQHPQNSRHMNNYQGPPPPSGGPLSRNQGPPPMHQRQQQQNHAGPPHSHHQQYQPQQPPPPHPPMQHQQQPPTPSQQQQRPSPHQHLGSPTQHPNKSHPPPHHQQTVPSSLSSPSSLSQQPPTLQAQHQPPQKLSPPHSQSPAHQAPNMRSVPTSVNGPLGPPPPSNQPRQPPVPMQVNGVDGQNSVDAISQRVGQVELNPTQAQGYHQPPPQTSAAASSASSISAHKVSEPQLSASSSSSSLMDSQATSQSHTVTATSPPVSVPRGDRRVGRGVETSPEERNKLRNLQEFSKNFVLESNSASSQEPSKQEEVNETSTASTSVSTTVTSTSASTASESTAQASEKPAAAAPKSAEKHEEEAPATPLKSTLNPNAKEFKPKSQPVPVETQSPSPQLRSSPHISQMVIPQHVIVPGVTGVPGAYIMPQRKRATVSLGTGVNDLTHQVTGQPLLATQTQPLYYVQGHAQPLPTGYQMINHRMVAPGSLTMAQTGQHAGLEQTATQNQPQPVFMTTQQPQIPAPVPAHLPIQSLPHPSSNQQAQPAHVPNPAPSPVQHQQHTNQAIPQPLPHHMSQGPPQSATPQPAHYPQMSMSYPHNLPTLPRTSISGQQSLAAAGGHPTVSISFPHMSMPQYTAYPNGNAAQYTFAPAQPQTSQNSSHGSGAQPQYVVMPNPQNHPSMQQHAAQPYPTTGLQYQHQHNIMQGPPQMPTSSGPNHNQGAPHLIHSGMPTGLHQQVSATQPGMYMQVPSTLPQFQHQQ